MSKYIDAVGQAYKEIQEKKLIDLQADINGGIKLDTETAVQEKKMPEDSMQNVTTADKKPEKFRKPDGGTGIRMVPTDTKKVSEKIGEGKKKDHDGDGDIDSDDYMKAKDKAIKKAIKKDKEGDVTMNPNMDKETQKEDVDKAVATLKKKTKDGNWHNKDGKVAHAYYDGKNIKRHMDRHGVKAPYMEESRIRTALKSVLAEKSHTAGATPPETMDDKLKGKGAKDMVNQPVEKDDTEEKGHDDASKAGRVTKPAAARNGGDNVRSGDQKIVNKVKEAYASMYKEESDD